MGSDAIANVPLSAYAKDSSEKKKGTRLAQLKQNKVDVRKEPWLSQVKTKGCKVETNGSCGAPPSYFPKVEGRKPQGNLPTKTRGDEHSDLLGTLDSEDMSWMSSSIDRTWDRSSFGKDFSGSGSSCSGSCSSSSSEEDDWEAVADALTAATNNRSSDLDQRTRPDPFGSRYSSNSPIMTKNTSTLKTVAVGITHRYQGNGKAWSPDDVFRPRSLPSLSKQQQKPTQDSERCFSRGPPILSWQRIKPQLPSSCPICCEDFDITDSSFRPCLCGFQLCLFCHKKILEEDGRCPGCRKQYDLVNPGGGSMPIAFQMTHSSSKKKRF